MASEPPDLLRDASRLAAVRATALAGPGRDEGFDRLTRLAARLLGAPVSLLSLVDGERQWIKSAAGTVAGEPVPGDLPLDRSVCRHVAGSGAVLSIADAAGEARGPAAATLLEHGMRSYAGVPLVSGGQAVGVLCVADTRPRRWHARRLDTLRELAELAVTEIERRRAEHDLAAAERLFRALVEQSLVGIYVVQDDAVRYASPRFRELIGAPPGWFDRPRHYLELVHPDDRDRVRENVRRRLEGEIAALRYSFRVLRFDGETLHMEVHGSRMELESRPAVIGVAIDVTERVRAERDREHAVLARDRFYAMMSHELRTPVSAIMLYDELLLSGVYDPLTDGQREALERSDRSARHLLDLINDLLDLSKLEAGRLETRVEEVEVAELVEGAVAELGPIAREQGCALELEVETRPLPVTGDARRVRQILLNLLSNAVKFGAGHPVQVRCGPCEGGIAVAVADHGPGIAPADLERIFEEFVQLGDSEVGTGLGLAIARRLAELQGGSLTAESRPGEGSTFRLVLPLEAPALASS
jgi:PAS domain S-box-containing protein